MAFLYYSCSEDDAIEPGANDTIGRLYVTSSPTGAQIFYPNLSSSTGKITPDTIRVQYPGTGKTFGLKMSGYRDTLVTFDIAKGEVKSIHVILTSAVTASGTIKIYETAAPAATGFSGLDLSALVAVSSSNPESDVKYSSGNKGLISAEKTSQFVAGSSSNLNDGVDAPASGWGAGPMPDNATFYWFIRTAENGYAKLKITSRGGGTGAGDPYAWIEVQWLYNSVNGSF